MRNYAKGGQIIAYKKDAPKFNKIGISDKYVIEAINEIGLQDVKFDKESIENKINSEFEELLKNTSNYLISEDSKAITNTIQNEIETRYNQGDTEENINSYKQILDNPSLRKSQYIDKYAETQKETINEWTSYLKQSEYPIAIKFLILKSVLNFNYDYKLNDLIKRNNKTIRNFTPFDAGSLSELVSSESENLLKDYTQIQIENSAKIIKNKELLKTSGNGTWLKFNGGSKTNEDERINNSKELAQLVQNTYWCTKTNSKSQLDGGDFYVYVTETNGEVFPRIAIRMDEDNVGEVRGNKSSAQDIEEEMLPIAEKFLTENITNGSGKKWLDGIKYNQEAIDFYKKINEEGLFKNSIEIFIKIKSKEKENLLDYADRNGHIVRIEKIIKDKLPSLPNQYYKEKEVVFYYGDFDNKKTKIIITDFVLSKITDLGQLTTIGGNADFVLSKITDLGQLTTIGGNADFSNSQITDLGQLTTIGGYADFVLSKITDLGQLTTIGGNAYFSDSKITDLGQLTTIGGDANFSDSKITDLGQLKTIGGYAYFQNSQITHLGKLTTIGRDAYFTDSKITDLGQLTTIGKSAYFRNSKITDLGQLTTIGEDAYFSLSQITDLGKLITIGGNADFSDSQITDLGQLTTIGEDAYFSLSQITDLGKLITIGKNANFSLSQITDLGKLTTIGGNAYFGNSEITHLGQLTTIGGNASFPFSKITNLGQLKTIGGNADFSDSKITDLGQLTTIGGNVVFTDSKITNLGQLKTIGGNAYFTDSKITNLGQLTTIGGDANFLLSQITDLGQLTTIGGDADFRESIVTDLGQLKTIGENAYFRDSKITNLGKLKTIGRTAFFGNLEELEEKWKRRQENKEIENEENDLEYLTNLLSVSNDLLDLISDTGEKEDIDFLKEKIKITDDKFSKRGEVSGINTIAQIWEWFGIKF